jgi:hypothetical protein
MTRVVGVSAISRRARTRKTVVRPSTLRTDSLEPLDVVVEDLSVSGFCFSSAEPIRVGTSIRLGLAGAGQADAEVAWREGKRHGSRFTPALAQSTIDAAFTNGHAGVTATIARELSMSWATTHLVRAAQVDTLDQGAWRIAPVFGFALAMLVGALSWSVLVLLLHEVLT